MSALTHRGSRVDPYALPFRFQASPSPLRRAARTLSLAAVAFAVSIGASVTLPVALGQHAFTVLSGSMEPALRTGDVVVVTRIAPTEARIGDVVSFRSPDVPGRTITHRVVDVTASGTALHFVTRGDANSADESWSIDRTGTIGRVEYRIPKLGFVTNRIGSKVGRFAFLVVPALLLALLELKRIWRPPSDNSGRVRRP
jgi:signal peptidase I